MQTATQPRPALRSAGQARAFLSARFYTALPALVIWLPAAAMALWVKYACLNAGGFLVASRQLGRSDPSELSIWERVSFFRGEVLVACGLVPLALFLLTVFLKPRWRARLVAGASIVASLVLFSQLKAFAAVGRFLSRALFSDLLRWARQDPALISSYVTPRSTLLLIAVLTATILLARFVSRRGGAIAGKRIFWSSVAAAAVCGAAPFVPRVPATSLHGSVLVESFSSLFAADDSAAGRFAALSREELIREYRRSTNAPPPRKDPQYWGKARGYDVFFFVLETLPAQSLAIDGEIGDLPNLKSLRETSFVAPRHYTTYPYSNRAAFSIFSGWYPSNTTRSFIQQHPHMSAPGLIRSLDGAGYDTGIYGPSYFRLEADDQMYGSLGFRAVKSPDSSGPVAQIDLSHYSWESRVTADEQSLALLEADLTRDLAAGRRFAFAFMPQVGHAPWPDIGHNNTAHLPQRRRAILEIEDRWIGRIAALLKRYGRLERTLIVVTGDHGVRTRREDPALPSGVIDAYTFHVPLILYAPKILDASRTIPWMTSHIDIAPTIMDLMGVEGGRDTEQGSPLWESDIAGRTTFFFGNHYFGCDGYYTDGMFFMRSSTFDSVYSNSRMLFSGPQMARRNSDVYRRTASTINHMAALQQAWAERFANSR